MTREYLCDTYTPEAELNKPLISLIMRSGRKMVRDPDAGLPVVLITSAV